MKTSHTNIVQKYLTNRQPNKIILVPPPPVNITEQKLNRQTRRTLAQIRSNHSPFLKEYLNKIKLRHTLHLFVHSAKHPRTTQNISSPAHTYTQSSHPGTSGRIPSAAWGCSTNGSWRSATLPRRAPGPRPLSRAGWVDTTTTRKAVMKSASF